MGEKLSFLGAKFPILLSPSYEYGSLFRLDEEKLSRLTGKWTQEILDNIETTIENIREDKIKVWHLQGITELTYLSLGVDPNSLLGRALDSYIADKESDASLLSLARVVFETGAIVVATVVTAPIGGIGGYIVGGVIGTVRVVEGIQLTVWNQAASLVSLDPTRADISAGEPDVLPILIDVMFLVPDLGQAVRLARGLGPAMRTLANDWEDRAI